MICILFPFVITICSLIAGAYSLAYALIKQLDHGCFHSIKEEQTGLFYLFGWIGSISLSFCSKVFSEQWKEKVFRSGYLLLGMAAFTSSIMIWIN
ncbi:hypothetical protein [Metabacillus idriensis]|uniref:hypothetical protein n=1 Tax=Metabacillus idriensis TaxID=324768 RepID=UPI0017495E27|nr:hypothetical protein [Metabacillus idriensis]